MRVVEEVVQLWRVSPNTSLSWCMSVRSDSERHPSLHLLFSSEELLTIGLSASFHYLVRLFARIAHHRPAFDLLTHSHLLCVSFLVGFVFSLASLLSAGSYTSPQHAPIPGHLPTLIVTPHGEYPCPCRQSELIPL